MKKKIKKILKKISPLVYFPEIIVLFLISKFKCKYLDNSWLVFERGDEAKDNGYHLFKHIQDKNINNKTYYLIKKDSIDYKKINKYKNIIEYGSYQHKIAYLLSECLISTHYHSINPWKFVDLKDFKKFYKLIIKDKKYVFLQHGITINDVSDYLGKKNTEFDLFICGANPEYKYVKDKFGYNESEVKYTGLARFDSLYNYKTKNQILLMPTWRGYLKYLKKEEFIKSEYYKQYQSLINNNEFIELLEKNNYTLIFYPHYEMQKYINCFSSESKNIIFGDKDEYDVQQLLKESKLLITDYSSVYFDFVYMKKPIIYYQFDLLDFSNKHYNKGYFEYKRDGFGEICNDEQEFINVIINYFDNGFNLSTEYENKVNNFFLYNDKKNCSRIVSEIEKIII